ncbi:MAG: T9SS type A sorting domain-containing protein [Bacteroidota bacterium]|nr:T9SS type A sorting domain-containing protein [Bacteroidota bacterium]
MRHLIFAAVIVGTFTLALQPAHVCRAQDEMGVRMALTVSNQLGRQQDVSVGILENATTGIDQLLGEVELPPPPPNEIFDVRLVSTPGKSQLGTGSLADYRPIVTSKTEYIETYTVAFQGGQGATGVVISRPDPMPGRVTRLVIDGNDMAGRTQLDVPYPTGQVTVVVTFNYAPLSFAANPSSITFVANNFEPLPSQDVEIIPQGDTHADWVLNADAEWLDIVPTSGAGRQTVRVAVVGGLMPTGTYTAKISVRSLQYPARLDIPVTLEYTALGVGRARLPVDMDLTENYPNPASDRTSFDVRLGPAAVSAAPPVLAVYDAAGRLVLDLSSKLSRAPGVQTIVLDTRDLPPGMYTYRLEAGGRHVARTMTVVR